MRTYAWIWTIFQALLVPAACFVSLDRGSEEAGL